MARAAGPPQPLNTGGVGGKIARYSPDGEWIAFEAHSMVDSEVGPHRISE